MNTEYPPKRRSSGRKQSSKNRSKTIAERKSSAGTTYPPRRNSKKKRMMRRKRILRRTFLVLFVCLLVAAAVLLWQRRPSEEENPPKETGGDTQVHSTVNPSEPEETDNPNLLTQAYGSPGSYDSVSNQMEVHIQYPDGDLEELEDAIRKWIQKTVLHYAGEMGKETLEKPAQLTANFESFRIGDRYVNVRFKGTFRHPGKEQTQDVIKTFNVDCTTGKVLRLEDYTGVKPAWLLSPAMKKAGITEKNSAIVDNWIIAEDGIALLLSGESFLLAPGEVKVVRFTDAELERIKANPPIDTSHIDPSKPVIALTFDDGPCKHTEKLLDIFAQYGGKGTFFVVGNLIDERPDVVKRIVAEGHEVGGHSWDHKDLSELSIEAIREQMLKTKEKIYQLTGYQSVTIRPPWGNVNDNVKAAAKENNLSMILWSVDTQDWMLQDADKVYQSVMSQVTNGAIILMHDLHGTTVNAMERVVPELIAQGYQLVTVPELLLYNEGIMEPGVTYRYR